MILATFDLQVTSVVPMKFESIALLVWGENVQNRFLSWLLGQPSWTSDQNDFSYFLIYKSPRYFLSNYKPMDLFIQKTKFKIDFQDGNCGGHELLAIFDLQVTSMILTRFQVNWPFGSGEEGENRFSRWPPWPLSWISDWKDFIYLIIYFFFQSTSHPYASYQVSSQLAFRFRRKSEKQIFKMRPFCISNRNYFSHF